MTKPRTYPLLWPEGWPRVSEGQRKDSRFSTDVVPAMTMIRQELNLIGATEIVISTNLPMNANGYFDQNAWEEDKRAWEAERESYYYRHGNYGGRPPHSWPGWDGFGDPGIAVYFLYKSEERVIACDKWRFWIDNLQAIARTLQALRGIERWGSSEILTRVYDGFTRID